MKQPSFLVLILFFALALTGLGRPCAGASDQVRPSILAGTWYPGDPEELQSAVGRYLAHADSHPLPQGATLLALVSPHAGYRYSGATAAYAYRVLQARPSPTVVVVAPSHRVPFQGISIYDRGPYETPLGRIPVDSAFIADLKDRIPELPCVERAHAVEHSVEIQLPFLQTVLPEFRLVPVLMGRVGWEDCVRLADVLASMWKDRPFVVVASTDLSHYHSDAEARLLDERLIDHVRNLDARRLWTDLREGRCEACGGAPLATVLLYARRFRNPQASILHYATSADATGDRSRVVGYLAAALWTRKAATADDSEAEPALESSGESSLTAQEREVLKDIARKAIEARLHGTDPPRIDGDRLTEGLGRKRGAFVTLKIQGRLRGCIGQIVGRHSLAETVARMAEAAAFQDPRFPPLRAEEWPRVRLEISALTPLRRIGNPGEIQVGVHGLYIRKGWRSGLLLPQVAVEYGWDRQAFLEHTCQKAGLPPDAWKDSDTEIYVFSAEVF